MPPGSLGRRCHDASTVYAQPSHLKTGLYRNASAETRTTRTARRIEMSFADPQSNELREGQPRQRARAIATIHATFATVLAALSWITGSK
jgi:hypothetical protein